MNVPNLNIECAHLPTKLVKCVHEAAGVGEVFVCEDLREPFYI